MLLSVAARIRLATGRFAVAQRLEGHRDLLRRLVGSRPRCQVRWRIGFRVAGSRRILIINEAPGILHRLDQSAFIVARRRPGLLVLNLGILQSRGVSGREPG